jgi:hypothetical protein
LVRASPGRLETLRGLLEYAVVANDSSLKAFVRSGYEYTRSHYVVGRLGWLLCGGCGCSIPRLLALAIRLSDAGIGDYWEDVDSWIRNQQSEQQLLDPELLKRVSEAGPVHVASQPQETSERVLERCLGAFAIYGRYPTLTSGDVHIGGCCVGNNSQALYYVWESIVRCANDVCQVNLLLNRASPRLDLDSYLPYEGKVVVRNKTAKKLYLRIPLWADKRRIRGHVDGDEASLAWFGNYLVFDALDEGSVVVVEFPVASFRERYSIHGQQFTCRFRGNTLVDISPRTEGAGYPLYTKRDRYKARKAPMKKLSRYVSSTTIEW